MKKVSKVALFAITAVMIASLAAFASCTPQNEGGDKGEGEPSVSQFLSLGELGLKTLNGDTPVAAGSQIAAPQGASITKIYKKAAQIKLGEKYGLCAFDGTIIVEPIYDFLDAQPSPIDQSVSSVLFTVKNVTGGEVRKGVVDIFGAVVVAPEKTENEVYVISEYGVLLEGVTYAWDFQKLSAVLNGSHTLNQYGQGIGVPLSEYFMVPVGTDYIYIVDKNNECKAQLDISDGVFYASAYFIVKQSQTKLPSDAAAYDYFDGEAKYAITTTLYDLKTGENRQVDFPYVLVAASADYNAFLSKIKFEKGDVINNAVFLEVRSIFENKTAGAPCVKLFDSALKVLMEFDRYQAPVRVGENRYILDSDAIGKILVDESGNQLASFGEADYFVCGDLIVTQKFDRFGAIDLNGLTAVEFTYDALGEFYDGAAIGVKGGKAYSVRKDGVKEEIGSAENIKLIGRGAYYVLEDGQHKIKTNKGEEIVILDSAANQVSFADTGIVVVSSSGQYYFLS